MQFVGENLQKRIKTVFAKWLFEAIKSAKMWRHSFIIFKVKLMRLIDQGEENLRTHIGSGLSIRFTICLPLRKSAF